jgi:hypothetical protein
MLEWATSTQMPMAGSASTLFTDFLEAEAFLEQRTTAVTKPSLFVFLKKDLAGAKIPWKSNRVRLARNKAYLIEMPAEACRTRTVYNIQPDRQLAGSERFNRMKWFGPHLMWFFVLLLATSAPSIDIQTIKLAKTSYVENFAGNPKISGSLLVGLIIGVPFGKYHPEEVGLYLSADARGRNACVEISSRDGRYFAQNAYHIPNEQGIGRFETSTKFAEQLAQYEAEELAILVRLVETCNSAEGGLLAPATLTTKSADRTIVKNGRRSLRVLVNADKERLNIILTKNGVVAATGICETARDAVRISFTSSCALELPDTSSAARYDLNIRVRDRFAWRDSHFSIAVPEA